MCFKKENGAFLRMEFFMFSFIQVHTRDLEHSKVFRSWSWLSEDKKVV